MKMITTISDNLWKSMMRKKMRTIERFISTLDAEELTYLVDYAIDEMQLRSDKMEEEQNKKGGK